MTTKIKLATNVSDVDTTGAADGNPLTYSYSSSAWVPAVIRKETVGSISTSTLDLTSGNMFADAPSTDPTYVFDSPPASGISFGFTLKVTPSATVTITWPTSVDWAAATAPTSPASGDTNIYTFLTTDGGTTWYGFLAGAAMA